MIGYDQGMMGGVNTSADYATLMGYGHVDESTGKVIVDDSLLQGGIVAVYYLGTLVGAFLGGWIGDKTGRIRTIALGAIWAIFGAGLQCSAQNHVWMICARLVNGVGTGILNAIVPVWSTETADHQSRGQFIAIEFTLNIFGVVVAYWMEFGLSFIDGGRGPFQWRFPIAVSVHFAILAGIRANDVFSNQFQIIPLLILFAIIWVFPESPRWLCKVGRDKEARYILGRLRGEEGEDKIRAEAEYRDIINIVQLEKSTSKQNTYWRMLFDFGDQGSGSLHNGRRVQLVVWLQIMQEWCGIAGVTVYAPTIFSIAGYGAQKSAWLSGLNNTTYMFATLICVFTIDRIGRRWTLYWGAAAQAVAMFIVGGMSRGGINASESGNTSLAASYGAAAAFG
jgi:MFS family permease